MIILKTVFTSASFTTARSTVAQGAATGEFMGTEPREAKPRSYLSPDVSLRSKVLVAYYSLCQTARSGIQTNPDLSLHARKQQWSLPQGAYDKAEAHPFETTQSMDFPLVVGCCIDYLLSGVLVWHQDTTSNGRSKLVAPCLLHFANSLRLDANLQPGKPISHHAGLATALRVAQDRLTK